MMSGPEDISGLNDWCAALYRSRGVAHQGVIAPELFVSSDDFKSDDPSPIIEGAYHGYALPLIEEMRFLPGEFSAVALASYGVGSYIGTLSRYGHGSILNERFWDSVTAKCAAVGLAAMGSVGEAEVLHAFDSYVVANRERAARHLTKEEHGGTRDDAFERQMEEFDRVIDALDSDAHERRHADWLRKHVKAVPDQDAALQKIAGRNRKFKHREQRDDRMIRFSQANQALADDLVRRMAAGMPQPQPLQLQYVQEGVLKDHVVAGDPFPVMVWSYGKYASIKEALDNRDFTGADLVIAPSENDAGLALLVAPNGFLQYGRIDLTPAEKRKCGLGLF